MLNIRKYQMCSLWRDRFEDSDVHMTAPSECFEHSNFGQYYTSLMTETNTICILTLMDINPKNH